MSADAIVRRALLANGLSPGRDFEAWGCVADLSREQVWAALESALARGDLARDLGPAGLRWRRVGPPR